MCTTNDAIRHAHIYWARSGKTYVFRILEQRQQPLKEAELYFIQLSLFLENGGTSWPFWKGDHSIMIRGRLNNG